jgi:hypothetical protein
METFFGFIMFTGIIGIIVTDLYILFCFLTNRI